jgi:hypothetical protein
MPTTRSSNSKSATSFADASTSFDFSDELSIVSTQVDICDLKTLMLSIQVNQKMIEAINSCLTEHPTSLESTFKILTDLDNTVQAVRTTVTNLPNTFDVKLETVQQDLCSDLMTALGNTFYTDLSKHHVEMTECFKTYATTMASISTDVINLNKNLTALQDATLSKIDVERLVVEKWQDELDPHIQSHYEFKQATTTKLETLDKTIQDTIDDQLRTHPLLQSSCVTGRSSTTRSTGPTGFHQATTKEFSVFKLQKELKEIKLTGDFLHDLEIFWGLILCAFTNLCQSDQAYDYYHDLSAHFTFEKHIVDPIKPPKYLSIDQAQVKRNYCSFGDALRIFLNSGTTIVEASSPKAYLKLLSLCDTQDGFVLLRDLVFSLSPQLSGDFHDYRSDIEALTFQGSTLANFIKESSPFQLRSLYQTLIMEIWLYLPIISYFFYDLFNVPQLPA